MIVTLYVARNGLYPQVITMKKFNETQLKAIIATINRDKNKDHEFELSFKLTMLTNSVIANSPNYVLFGNMRDLVVAWVTYNFIEQCNEGMESTLEYLLRDGRKTLTDVPLITILKKLNGGLLMDFHSDTDYMTEVFSRVDYTTPEELTRLITG